MSHLRGDFLVQLLQPLLRRLIQTLVDPPQQELQEVVLRPPARHRSGHTRESPITNAFPNTRFLHGKKLRIGFCGTALRAP